MSHYCFSCSANLALSTNSPVGRRDACPKCNADLHCCRNCKFFDETAYNQCHEPQAERVIEKTQSNYCDYFEFRIGQGNLENTKDKQSYLKDLDDLFKR